VAQTSKSAVPQASKPAGLYETLVFWNRSRPADLEIGGTADLEICATDQDLDGVGMRPAPATLRSFPL